MIIVIDRVALAKKGDNALGSVRPSVCPIHQCALSRSKVARVKVVGQAHVVKVKFVEGGTFNPIDSGEVRHAGVFMCSFGP